MSRWNTAMEEELVVVLKDWLKHQGRTCLLYTSDAADE